MLIFVTNTLALVRFRLTAGANVCRIFTDQLLVDAGDLDIRCRRALYFDAVDDIEFYRMGVTDVEHQLLSADLGTETDTNELQLLLESLADTDHHVVDQRTSRSV